MEKRKLTILILKPLGLVVGYFNMFEDEKISICVVFRIMGVWAKK